MSDLSESQKVAGKQIDKEAKEAKIRRKALMKVKKNKAKTIREIKSNERKKVTAARKLVKDCKELKIKQKNKPKRAPSEYNLFVKKSMKRPGVQALDPSKRLKRISFLWKAFKNPNPNPPSNQ
jgi:hypothetical protein